MAHGVLEVGVAESEPTVEGPGRCDPVGSEQGMGRFSIQQLDGESGHGRQDMGPAEDAGKGAAEFPLDHRIGRDRIDAALPGGVRQPLQDHLRQVVHMNPALPLGSRGEGRAESEAVQGHQLAQDASLGRQHQPNSQGDMAPSEGAEGGGPRFPVPHHLSEEVVSGWR